MSSAQTRYAVVFLLTGEVGSWHAALTKEIEQKFQTWNLHEYVPPHVTIFRPFIVEHIESIKEQLRQWLKEIPVPGNITISGFGHFEDRVVYAAVEGDAATCQMIEDLRKKIKTIPGMPEEDIATWEPHATLAHRIPSETVMRIWEYLQTVERSAFTLPFTCVSLLRFDPTQGRWVIEAQFPLQEGIL